VTLISLWLGSYAVRRLSQLRDDTFWPLTDPLILGDLVTAAAAVASGVAAVGLWRLQRWAYKPLAIAGGLVTSRMLVDQLIVADGVRLPLAAGTAIMVVIVLYAVDWARTVVRDPAESAPAVSARG
jgi:hypothetical protein